MILLSVFYTISSFFVSCFFVLYTLRVSLASLIRRFHFLYHDKYKFDLFDRNNLTEWNAALAYKLYLQNFKDLIEYCDNAPIECIWVTMSWAHGFDKHVTTSQIASTMTGALTEALKSKTKDGSTKHSVRVLDRWFSSIQVGGSDMVDNAHYDNLSNREDLARLMGIMCEQFELDHEVKKLPLPPGRLEQSRKDGGTFCRLVIDKCMTEGIVFSRRYCAPKILGITGRRTWKYTCQWKTKVYQCGKDT